MNHILYLIGKLLSLIYPYNLERKINNQIDKIYAVKISKCLSGG